MGDTLDKVKKGFKEMAGGVKEGVKETAEATKKGVEKATDSDTYTGIDEERQSRDYNQAGGKEPMNPDDIGEGAIDRGQDTEITEEGHKDTDSPEAREKYRKKGMTEV